MTPVAGRAATPVTSERTGPADGAEAVPTLDVAGEPAGAPATAVSPAVPAPIVVAAPVVSPPGVEGAAAAPEHPWVVRNRQLGVPAGMLLVMSSAALIAVIATGATYGYDRTLEVYDQVERRDGKQMASRLRRANFEGNKTFDAFDFNFNPKIQKHKIIDLATCSFVTRHENVLLLGKTGVGKSHVAQALGQRA